MTFSEKKEKLAELLSDLCAQDTALAFSGGVDSTLLLSMMKEAADRQGTRLIAVTADTFLHPVQDRAITETICRDLQVTQEILELDELHEAGIFDNPPDRCYRCKKTLFTKIRMLAASKGIFTVVDGTNADDPLSYRPGLRAIGDLEIASPLKDAGLGKEDIRALAEERSLSVAQRPSTPCLATRFPYGTMLTPESLQQVDTAEDYLRSFGLYNVRVRVHDDLARIETDPSSFPVLLEHREEIIAQLKKIGYRYSTVDLEGFRSGSFDEDLNE